MKRWDIQKTQFKVADFLNWAKRDELDLSPMFQRRAVWAKGAKSYLLDTILRGLPVPPIILRDLPPDVKTFSSIREVVDGQQRLRTLLTYIAPKIINDYDAKRDDFKILKAHNPDLAGLGFRDLKKQHQQNILDYQFMVHIFPSETDDREILEIFARLNATGTKLNNQELRNSQFFGEFKTRAFAFAAENLGLWRKWKLFSESSIARMDEVEFTSELFILAMNGISDNKKSLIDKTYEEFDEEFKGYLELEKRFRHILSLLDENLSGVRADLLKTKAIVYPLTAAIYEHCYGLGSSLVSAKPKQLSKKAVKVKGVLAEQLLDQKAPKRVLLAFEARTSQAKNRRVLTKYFSS